MTEETASWLIRSKVTPPRQLFTLIERNGLLSKLDNGAHGSLVIIEAPGGYGKSSLLAQWRQRRIDHGEAVAWLSIDEDDDADALAAYLHFAAQVAGVETQLTSNSEPDGTVQKRTITQSAFGFLASVERHGAPVRLILDDCERLSAETRAAVLPLLVRRLPENATLVLVSREPIPVSTVDFEHRGLVTRLGAEDLRFSRRETSRLWEGYLTERQIAQLEAETEGWPVLVRLLFSAAEIGAFDIRHVREIGHSDLSITNYFDEKILSRLSQDLRELLLAASVFETATEEILSEVLAIENLHELGDRIKSLESFITPLAAEPNGFRFHPMMRDYLSHRLRIEDPHQFQELNAKAARWYSSSGKHVQAVRHAIASDDRELLLEILAATGGAQSWIRDGLVQFKPIDRMLPDDVVLASPHMGLMRVIILLKSSKQSEADNLYRKIVAHHGDLLKSEPTLRLSDLMCQSMLAVYHGLFARQIQIEKLEQQLSSLDHGAEAFVGYLRTTKCLAAHQAGQLNEAILHCEEAIKAFRLEDSKYGECYAHLHLAMISGLKGEASAAKKSFSKVAEIARQDLSNDEKVKPLHHILYKEFEHEAAPFDISDFRRLKSSAFDILRGEGWLDIYAASCRTLSEKAYLVSGSSDAITVLETFSELAKRNEINHLMDIITAQHALLLAADGEVDEAVALLKTIERFVADPEGYLRSTPWRVGEVVAEAALATREDITNLAVWRCFRDQAHSSENKRLASRIAAGVAARSKSVDDLRFLSNVLSPSLNRALLFNWEALRLGCGREIDESYPLIAKSIEDVSRQSRRKADADSQSEESSIFSEKEVSVLRELAKGYSDKQIARVLNLSEHGVRYHLKNIYVKLGAGNRTDAVMKAQARGVVAG